MFCPLIGQYYGSIIIKLLEHLPSGAEFVIFVASNIFVERLKYFFLSIVLSDFSVQSNEYFLGN